MELWIVEADFKVQKATCTECLWITEVVAAEQSATFIQSLWITEMDSEVQNAMDCWFGVTQRCRPMIQDSRRFDASYQEYYVQIGGSETALKQSQSWNGQPSNGLGIYGVLIGLGGGGFESDCI